MKKHGTGKGLMTLAKKHGIGEGLMIVWWATYPVGGDISTGNGYTDREVVVSPISTSVAPKKGYWGFKSFNFNLMIFFFVHLPFCLGFVD